VIRLRGEIHNHQMTFTQTNRELRSLKRVSTLAYTDYQSLQEKYETEKLMRIKAETYAREVRIRSIVAAITIKSYF